MENSKESTEYVGKVIEGYKINKFLGSGNFSTVYLAERKSDSVPCAIKIVNVRKFLLVL